MIALWLACAAPAIDVAVRGDPVVFALGGWSVGVDAALEGATVRASLAAFHVEVPEVLVPVVASPSTGLRVIEDALQLAIRADLGGGWWAGPEVYLYRLTYLRGGAQADGREAYVHASLGWRWFVIEDVALLDRLFVEPWVTLGLPVFGTGGTILDGERIADRSVNWHATVSIGAEVF